MIKKALFLFAVLPYVSVVMAQGMSVHRHNYMVDLSDKYKLYSDSLRKIVVNYKGQNDSLNADGAYARLFTPFTFYRSTPDGYLLLGRTPTDIDKTLLYLYLRRPDLVQITEKELASHNHLNEKPAEQSVSTDLVDMVAPEAIEPDAGPVNIIVKKPNFWTFSGDYYMQFLQNYVSENWYKGGQSNYSMVGALTVKANYNNKQKVKWDNTLEFKLGFQTTRDDTLHGLKTSEDLIRYTGKIGLQATRRWYYTLQTIAQTQFMRSYRTNDRRVYSDFMSPFTLNISLGMDYSIDWLKSRLKGSVHLAPLAYNFKYSDRLQLSPRFGIKSNKHQLHDFGSEINMDVTWIIVQNVKWRSRLYFYTTYKRTELEWENYFNFQINKYLSANLMVYPRFDDGVRRDSHHGYWQLKEYSSLGFSISF